MDADQTREVARTFDDWAEAGRGEGMEEGHRITAGELVASLPVGQGDRFLDLGTGIGWAARDVAETGAEAVGIDVSPRMVARARSTDGPRVDYALASFEALPFEDRAFQAAFSMEALYYADDLEAALAEIGRVLDHGATLDVLIDYYEENEASHGWPEKTGVGMHLLSEADWLEALRRAGLTAVHARRLRAPEGHGDAWKHEVGSLHLTARAPEA